MASFLNVDLAVVDFFAVVRRFSQHMAAGVANPRAANEPKAAFIANAVAGAVSVRPQCAGTASGITGFLQMGLGAPAAQMVSHLLTDATTALPMVLVMFGFAVASTAAFVGLVARR